MTSEAVDLEMLHHCARLAGFAWSDGELEALRPQVEAMLRLLRALDDLPLGDAEPATHYRTV